MGLAGGMASTLETAGWYLFATSHLLDIGRILLSRTITGHKYDDRVPEGIHAGSTLDARSYSLIVCHIFGELCSPKDMYLYIV